MPTLDETRKSFSKFTNKPFRTNQPDAIKYALESNKKYTVINAPTGAGKSLIGAVIGKQMDSATYLVHSKALQEQIVGDFPYPEFALLMGRNNYDCIESDNTCDNCPKTKPKCGDCPYLTQKSLVLKNPLKILNYTYFLFESNFMGQFANDKCYILDEADPQKLELCLMDFIKLSFTNTTLNKLNISMPKYKTTFSDNSIPEWKYWAEDTAGAVKQRLSKLIAKSAGWKTINSDYQRATLREKKKLNTMKYKLKLFLKYVDKTWLQSHRNTKFGTEHTFEPVWLTPELTHEYFWKHMPNKVIMMSATFPPLKITADLLGLPLADMDYIELPSTFPIKNRQIHFDVAGDLSFKTFNSEIEYVVDRVREIIAKHPNEKGLIHTVSYKLTNHIMSIDNPRLITHNTKDRGAKLTLFKQSHEPLIMVSPSMDRGLDLPDDKCRFLIIAKAPYLSLADKKVKQRVYSGGLGKVWYKSDACMTMIQQTGRGVRTETDYCTIYIIEKQAKDLIVNNLGMFPQYWKESIV